MSLPAIALILFCVILAALTVFQIALIVGAPLGHFAWGGQHRVLPRKLRISSVTSIVLYAAFALIALDRTGVIELLPREVSVVLMWVLTGYFALGIVLNGISRSVPERNLMTPVCLVLALLSWAIAVS